MDRKKGEIDASKGNQAEKGGETITVRKEFDLHKFSGGRAFVNLQFNHLVAEKFEDKEGEYKYRGMSFTAQKISGANKVENPRLAIKLTLADVYASLRYDVIDEVGKRFCGSFSFPNATTSHVLLKNFVGAYDEPNMKEAFKDVAIALNGVLSSGSTSTEEALDDAIVVHALTGLLYQVNVGAVERPLGADGKRN